MSGLASLDGAASPASADVAQPAQPQLEASHYHLRFRSLAYLQVVAQTHGEGDGEDVESRLGKDDAAIMAGLSPRRVGCVDVLGAETAR